ncbi:MAG TPA: glycosyltransferase family 4 protein [Ramlibacter sp.]|nr:glycosyltransferase family 4 protein [Ramlibacter sp.]
MFEPDGYRTDGKRLMGRHAAGNGFLRAAVAAHAGRPIVGYTPRKASAEVFSATVAEMDAGAKAQWLGPNRPDLLSKLGHLYLPGPALGSYARERLRTGPGAWSLTGVTHTTASDSSMDAICELLTAPVMPWDALICTSNAVLGTVKVLLNAQADYLRWRLGKDTKMTLPQLPVIPLGVHCDDFAIDPSARAQARQALGIADDEVVAVFLGRLAFHAKAHPHAMYTGLQAAATKSGRKLVLLQCGWFANDSIEQAFRSGAAATCPDVRCLFTDGRDSVSRGQSWAAADFFISLSDNIQETFGLSPIEAMAAGLPVVVTDWDGYKDTVRDGIDGFRIPTWQPVGGTGTQLAYAYETAQETYDMYCGLSCAHVAVDLDVLADRLAALATDDKLRARLGDAGKARAREMFDWPVVYRRYEGLWRDLDKIRASHPVAKAPAPRAGPARMDPFIAFGLYPTAQVIPATQVSLRTGSNVQSYESLAQHALFSYARGVIPTRDWVSRLVAMLESGPKTVASIAKESGTTEAATIRAVAVLGKMGVVDLLAAGSAAG